MTTITRTYDIPDTSDAAGFARLIDALRHYDPIEARCAEIEEALNDPFIRPATAHALLDKLAELITHQEKE